MPDSTQGAMPDAAPGALDGLRVLDMSRVLAAPWAGQILGDFGAEVVKVEQPGQGDDTRRWGPPFLQGPDGPSDAGYFLAVNRNKRAVAIDFSKPEGVELLRRLAAQSDVLLENYKTGTLKRYGLDYETLSAVNPRLIYCSVTGFGQTGPYATRGGYDFLIQGMSGVMSVTGQPDGEPGEGPVKVGLPIADIFTGMYATTSILMALNERHRSGLGQYIDCALLDSQVAVLVNQGMNYLLGGAVPRRLGNAHPNVVPYRDFPTADGHVLVTCGNSGQFLAFCRLLGLDDVAADPRFAENGGRLEHRAELERRLGEATARWRSADLFAAMDANGVPGGPIYAIDQTLADPQIESRRMLREMQRPDGTAVKVIGFPGQLSRTPATYRIAPQRHGQDTDAVLRERLGLAEAELDALRTKGAIGS